MLCTNDMEDSTCASQFQQKSHLTKSSAGIFMHICTVDRQPIENYNINASLRGASDDSQLYFCVNDSDYVYLDSLSYELVLDFSHCTYGSWTLFKRL